MKHYIIPLITLSLFGGIDLMVNLLSIHTWQQYWVGNTIMNIVLGLIVIILTTITLREAIKKEKNER